jgi:hypothetical protein
MANWLAVIKNCLSIAEDILAISTVNNRLLTITEDSLATQEEKIFHVDARRAAHEVLQIANVHNKAHRVSL